MEIFSNLNEVNFSSCVVSIGNFDGVHIGHQALLKTLIEQKKKYKVPAVVMSFNPHPVEFFTKKKIRLFSVEDLTLQLKTIGIDYLILLKFDQALSSLNADDFLEKKLFHLRPKAIVVGEDFCFGYKALGTVEVLKTWSLPKGIDVQIFPAIYWNSGKVSSSRLRSSYKAKRWAEVEALLGRSVSNLDHKK